MDELINELMIWWQIAMPLFVWGSRPLLYEILDSVFIVLQGILELFSGVGMMVGPVLGGVLYQVISTKSPYAVLVICLFIYLFIHVFI